MTKYGNNKFKSGMKDLYRKEHTITETSQFNIEGLGLLYKVIIGVFKIK